MPRPWAGSATDKRPARGRSPRVPVTRFELPAPAPLAGDGLESQSQEIPMTSPYLDRPLIPLAAALPPLLESIEANLTNKKLEAAEKRRLRRRAELIRGLLAPSQIT